MFGAGIIENYILGLFMTDSNLNDDNYVAALQNSLVLKMTKLYPDPAKPQIPANMI